DESAISLQARNPPQVIAVEREARPVGVIARHGYALPVVAVGPSVIAAGEIARRAFTLAAHGGGPMRASVHQRVDFAAAVAGQDDRAQAEVAGDEIVGLGDFALVAEVNPRAAEDPDHLLGEDRRVGVERAMDPLLLPQVIPSRSHVAHTSP